ncbi:MAG: signal peptidase I [Deltaproteobacteria bacterium]|nr:signal peptidase I [Deltaproteobacteria bacterium]
MKFFSRIKYISFLFVFFALLVPGFLRLFFFVFEPYKIPSESMMPTLLKGDHIWVRRIAYGIKLPPLTGHFFKNEGPSRGDVVVFTMPGTSDLDYVKRVMGIPGDRIAVTNGVVFINGFRVDGPVIKTERAFAGDVCTAELSAASKAQVPDEMEPLPYAKRHGQHVVKLEMLPSGHKYFAQYDKQRAHADTLEITVPADSYFVMGDNRDSSSDSRQWGFVPRKNIAGQATSIWLSINHDRLNCAGPLGKKDGGPSALRWYRFFRSIY